MARWGAYHFHGFRAFDFDPVFTVVHIGAFVALDKAKDGSDPIVRLTDSAP
jgi:hypothetical protein